MARAQQDEVISWRDTNSAAPGSRNVSCPASQPEILPRANDQLLPALHTQGYHEVPSGLQTHIGLILPCTDHSPV